MEGAPVKKIDRTAVLELGIVALIAFLAIVAYGRLTALYFATDEWWAMSYAIAHQDIKDLLQPAGVYAPSANLFISWLYRTFKVDPLPWAVIALALHMANSILVYLTFRRLTAQQAVGFLAAVAFAILPMGSQFLHQLSLMPTSGMATTFALAGLFAYVNRLPLLAGALFAVGLSFSPYVAPFVGLYLLTELALISRPQWWLSLLRALPTVLIFALYLYVQKVTSLMDNLQDRPVAGDNTLVERLQVIGQKLYQSYAEILLNLPNAIDPREMIQASTIFLVSALVLIGLVLWRKQWLMARSALIGLLWVPVSLVLFSTLNTVSLDATFPGRYFYVTTVGLGLLAGSLIIGLIPERYKIRPRWPIQIVATILATLIGLIYYLPQSWRQVNAEVKLGQTRKMIMTEIDKAVPHPLGRDAFFCFTSNTGHYGVGPEVIPLPFVHNFGFNLLVTYRANDHQIKPFFSDNDYFVSPSSPFYYYSREKSDPDGIGPGIGFATDLAECRTYRERFANIIGLEEVYGFAYDGAKGRLIDISVPLRQYLAGNESVKDQLYPW